VSDLPQRLGVVGAGTMGSGIAQLGCLAGIHTVLHDPVPEALEGGAAGLRAGLAKGAERGRWSAAEANAAAARLATTFTLDGLAGCDLVIEAAPERPALKRELFAALSAICGERAVLATNTSSIPVTSLASAARVPSNVVGMHFFNPAPLMRLLEVIAADQTSDRALALAAATGEAMGKRVIVAQDGPGFLVNRCGRPFGAEALRLVQERVATPAQVDRICRLGGGFRMGPFELMDLVGIDVGFEVAKSFTELSFGEPRWKPSPLQARMVAAGRLGRKAGRGWYEYGDGPHRPEDPPAPDPAGGEGRRVEIGRDAPAASLLSKRAKAAGYEVSTAEGDGVAADDLRLVPCAARSAGRGTGFNLLLPEPRLVELTGERSEAAERFFASLGFHTERVKDSPGLVLGRIVCQLVNEACFAVGEGVGTREDVDAGVELGLNHPRGPMTWGAEIGYDAVLGTIDGLWEERREERYRPAPLLRKLALG
jgi:3-hydroxybutyryl-CoA dehydrogenase